jgi:hypothetical protein
MRSSTCHLTPLVSPLHFVSCDFGSQHKLQIADGPYKPPLDFDLLDYKAVGTMLLDLTQSYHFDDVSPPEMDEDFGFTSPLKWDMLALPKLVSQAQFHSSHSVFPHTLVYHLLDNDRPFREPKQETKRAPSKRPAAGLPKTIPHPHTVLSVASTTTTTREQPTAGLSSRYFPVFRRPNRRSQIQIHTPTLRDHAQHYTCNCTHQRPEHCRDSRNFSSYSYCSSGISL